MSDDGATLAVKLLRLMGVRPPAPSPKPVTDWVDKGCSEACRWEHTVVDACRFPRSPRLEPLREAVAEAVPHAAGWQRPVPIGAFDGCDEVEQAILHELADLTRTRGPWGAAFTAFGGGGEARDATGTGLSATVGREPGSPAPR